MLSGGEHSDEPLLLSFEVLYEEHVGVRHALSACLSLRFFHFMYIDGFEQVEKP
jgi:hypothetical protein